MVTFFDPGQMTARLDRAAVRLRQIAAEVLGCRTRIANMEKSGEAPETIEDERLGLLQQVRRLEEEKALLLSPNDGGD